MRIIKKPKIAIVALAAIMPLFGMAQKNESYKVVKVQGEIQRVKTGNLLTLGENVISNENFEFKTISSRAVVVNKEKGCLILSSKANNDGPQFLPSSNKMSVRAALPTTPSEVIDYYFDCVFVGGHDSLKVDSEALKLSNENYFSISYELNNSTYTEKMELKNGKLALPSGLYDKKPSKVTIYYNDEYGVNGQSTFTPVYADKDVLVQEIGVIFATLKGKRNEKISASTTFVNDFYGKTNEESIGAWIKNNTKY